jgi:hypothetical protein
MRIEIFARIGKLILSSAVTLCLFQSCEFDQGLGPQKTKITGSVMFVDTASRPQNVDEVRVVASAEFPPAGIADIYFSNAVRFDRDTAAYEILAPEGSYAAIGVLWKPHGGDWSFSSLLGFYGFKPPLEASLRPVHLTKEKPVATGVDIFALWSFAQFDARIQGTITFVGEWPEDTESVVLGGFNEIPDLKNISNSLLLLGGIDLAVPKFVSSHRYQMAVRNGVYKFVGLFWKGRKIAWQDIRAIGFYRMPEDPSRPGTVQVDPNGTVSGIDFVADFSTLPDGVRLGGIP